MSGGPRCGNSTTNEIQWFLITHWNLILCIVPRIGLRGLSKYTSAINTAWSFSFCIEMSRANACGWLGWDDGGKFVNGSPCFWPLSIKGTKLSASSVIALLTLKAGKSLLYTNMSIYKPNVDLLLSNTWTMLEKSYYPMYYPTYVN